MRENDRLPFSIAGLQNYGTIDVSFNGSLGTTAGQTLLNQGTIYLMQGAINSTGPVVNNATISGTGFLSSVGGLTNNGLITQGSGPLYLGYYSASLANNGTINLASGQVDFLSGNLNNSGGVSLNGANLTGGNVNNLVGGTINGPGLISSAFTNAGTVAPGSSTLNITSAWTNIGLVQLNGGISTLTGGTINNTGTIQGAGIIGSGINNSHGTITPLNGSLTISGTLTNPTAGTIAVSTGNQLLVTSGLATTAGLISLTGGTFDNGGAPMTNTGQITGYGTLRTGGLTNAGHITLAGTSTDNTTTVTGNVTNNTGQVISIQNQPAIFTGNVVNNGTIITVGTTVTFAGSYTGNSYLSDPSKNIFQSNVTITAGGSMTGATGDNFSFFGGLVTNNGTFNSSGSVVSTDNFINNATFIQTGPQSWSSGTIFVNAAGTALFGSDAGAGGQNLLVNASGGVVTFATTQHLAGLNISTNGTAVVTGAGNGARSMLYTPLLSDAGKLDLIGNDLDLQSGASAGLTALTSLATLGFANGTWTGNGIVSSSAASDTTHLTAVGVILNAVNSSTPLYATFDGSPVALNDVLAKYTYYGDANLDGKVDGSDYSRLDAGYLTHATGWFNGDFNYDGVIDGSDYALIDNAFNQQGVRMNAEVAAQVIAGGSSVPEPSVGLLSIGALTGLRRRHRRPPIGC